MTDHVSPDQWPHIDHAADERLFLQTRSIWAAGLGLAVLVAASLGLMRAFVVMLGNGGAQVQPVDVTQETYPPSKFAPLSAIQHASRDDYDKQQRGLLGSYGWIDQQQHLAHIPIERAMQLTVQKYGKHP
jgi:hypothetical protein